MKKIFTRVIQVLAIVILLAGAWKTDSAFANGCLPVSVSNEAQLVAAINCFNSETVPATYVITLTADIDLTASTPAINNTNTGVELLIDGDGYTVDGQSIVGVRPFEVAVDTTVTMRDITITNAKPNDDFGGGVRNSGTLTIEHSAFINNISNVASGGGSGGAIDNYGVLNIESSTFSGNIALANISTPSAYGGAIVDVGDAMTINNSTFSGNQATSPTGNGAIGGAIYTSSDEVIITNSTFFGNQADSSGGAILIAGPSAIIKNSTIAGNYANNLTGSAGISNNGNLTLENSILADNFNDAGPKDCSSDIFSVISNINNLIESSDGCGAAAFTADPNLGPLQNNGGPTMTMALLSGSPAIDAGVGCVSTDQRGIARPQGVACDLGAYEATVATLKSQGASDGWILESSETSSTGGSLNKKSKTLYVGDDASNRQYRSILSFNTSYIPENANITSVMLSFKKAGITNGNPLIPFKGFILDVKKGNFNTAKLQLADFNKAAKAFGPFKPALSTNGWFSGWYEIDLTDAADYINTAGNTQIRLRLQMDDNNNSTINLLKLYSGNAAAGSRPQLIVEYALP